MRSNTPFNRAYSRDSSRAVRCSVSLVPISPAERVFISTPSSGRRAVRSRELSVKVAFTLVEMARSSELFASLAKVSMVFDSPFRRRERLAVSSEGLLSFCPRREPTIIMTTIKNKAIIMAFMPVGERMRSKRESFFAGS